MALMAFDMKAIFAILGIFILVLLLLFLAPAILEFSERRQVPEMTPEKVQKLFTAAGGIEEVDREARGLFDKFGAKDGTFLYPEDLSNAPAVFFLYSNLLSYSGREYTGTRIAIWPEDGRHLEIRFGNHWVGKQIFIFDFNSTTTFHPPSNWFQISSNIFVSR